MKTNYANEGQKWIGSELKGLCFLSVVAWAPGQFGTYFFLPYFVWTAAAAAAAAVSMSTMVLKNGCSDANSSFRAEILTDSGTSQDHRTSCAAQPHIDAVYAELLRCCLSRLYCKDSVCNQRCQQTVCLVVVPFVTISSQFFVITIMPFCY